MGSLVGRVSGDFLFLEPIAARRRAIQAPQQIHQGRLARSGGSHQGDHLPLLDLERNAAQHGDLNLPHVVGLGDFLQPDERHGIKSKVEGPKSKARPRTKNLDLGRVSLRFLLRAPAEERGKEGVFGGGRSLFVPLLTDDDPRPLFHLAGHDFDFGSVGQARLHLDRSGKAVIVHPDGRKFAPRPASALLPLAILFSFSRIPYDCRGTSFEDLLGALSLPPPPPRRLPFPPPPSPPPSRRCAVLENASRASATTCCGCGRQRKAVVGTLSTSS